LRGIYTRAFFGSLYLAFVLYRRVYLDAEVTGRALTLNDSHSHVCYYQPTSLQLKDATTTAMYIRYSQRQR